MGKVKTLGEQGSRVLGVNPSVSRTFEGQSKEIKVLKM